MAYPNFHRVRPLLFICRGPNFLTQNQSMLVAWTEKKDDLYLACFSWREVDYLRRNVLGNTTQRVNKLTKAAAAAIISIIPSRSVLMILL